METIFVTESREMLFTGTEDIDVRPLHSSELHYEGDSREEALRAAHKVSAASRVGVCQRGFARFVATVSEITRDGEGFTEHMDTVHTVDPLDRMPELRTLAREAAANRADGKIIRHIAGHTEAIDTAKRAGDYYSLYRVEGSAFGDFSCYRVGHAPYNGTLYLPAGSTITALPPSTSFSSHSWSDAANSCANTRTRSMRSITGSSRRESR